MSTVNQVDMQMSFFEFFQKSVKWYKKIAFHLIDLAVFNAYVLFKMRNLLNPLFSDFKYYNSLRVFNEIFIEKHD